MADNNTKKKEGEDKGGKKPFKITPEERKLLDFIGQFESKGGDYNILYGGYKGEAPPKPITEMTIREVRAFQDHMVKEQNARTGKAGSSAVGGHQIMRNTLDDLVKQLGISEDEIFSKNLQDKLIVHRVGKMRGFNKFLKGEIDTLTFAKNLSKEFASIPNPETGRSYYDGDGLNKSLTDVDTLINQLDTIKGESIGDVSINPDVISNNPDLPMGDKEELSKINESQGLEQSVANDLLVAEDQNVNPGITRMLHDYATQRGGGTAGSLNIQNLVQDDATQKQMKDENAAKKALGHTGEISSFDKDFNLLDYKFKKGGQLNDKDLKDTKKRREAITMANRYNGVNDKEKFLKGIKDPELGKLVKQYGEMDGKSRLQEQQHLYKSILKDEGKWSTEPLKYAADQFGSTAKDITNQLFDTSFNDGGSLQENQQGSLLTEYGEGGSHEENPNGGIPVGQNKKGGFNLVEEGETRFNDYIFSNAYKLSKEDAERFNINPKYAGKAFSDISKDINDQMELRPFDRLTKKTSEGNLQKLVMAQETLKQQEEQPQGMMNESFNHGGSLHTNPNSNSVSKSLPTHSELMAKAKQDRESRVFGNSNGGYVNAENRNRQKLSSDQQEVADRNSNYTNTTNKIRSAVQPTPEAARQIANDQSLVGQKIKDPFQMTGSEYMEYQQLKAEFQKRKGQSMSQSFEGGGDLNPTFDMSVTGENEAMYSDAETGKLVNGPSSGGPSAGSIVGAAGAALELGQIAFGDTGIDTSGASGRVKAKSVGSVTASSALKGASAGAAFGPWGAAIGGVVGAGAGVLGGIAGKNDELTANRSSDKRDNNVNRDTYAKKGGLLERHLNKDTSFKNGGDTGGCGGPGEPPCTGKKEKNWYDRFIPNSFQNIDLHSGFPTSIPELLDTTPGYIQPNGAGGSWEDEREWTGGSNNVGDVYPYRDKVQPVDYSAIRRGYKTGTNPMVTATGDIPNPYAPKLNPVVGSYIQPFIADKFRAPTEGLKNTLTSHGKKDMGAKMTTGEHGESKSTTPDIGTGGQFTAEKFQPAELLRYAPSVGNAISYLTAPDAEVESYDRLGNRFDPNYVDERSLEVRTAQSAANTRSAITNASGGDQGGLRSSLLGSQINESNALSDAMMKADQINRQQDNMGQEFNLNVDRTNQQIDMREKMANAQNRAAAYDNKQQLLQNVLSDMGEIGKEEASKRTLKNLTGGYTADGRKVVSKENAGSLTGIYQDQEHELLKQLYSNLLGRKD